MLLVLSTLISNPVVLSIFVVLLLSTEYGCGYNVWRSERSKILSVGLFSGDITLVC